MINSNRSMKMGLDISCGFLEIGPFFFLLKRNIKTSTRWPQRHLSGHVETEAALGTDLQTVSFSGVCGHLL